MQVFEKYICAKLARWVPPWGLRCISVVNWGPCFDHVASPLLPSPFKEHWPHHWVMASFEAALIQWESQNMLSWKGPTRTINSNPWPWAVPPPRVTSPSAWDYCPKASWTCVRLVLWPLPWEACPRGEAAGSRSGIPQCMSFTFRRDKLIWARLSGHLMRQSWMQQCNEAGADSGLCSRALCNVDFRPEVPLKWQADTQKSFEQQLSDKQKPSTSPL